MGVFNERCQKVGKVDHDALKVVHLLSDAIVCALRERGKRQNADRRAVDDDAFEQLERRRTVAAEAAANARAHLARAQDDDLVIFDDFHDRRLVHRRALALQIPRAARDQHGGIVKNRAFYIK